MAKEYSICPFCGLVVANDDMHAAYHQWVQATIARMQMMLDIVWEDAKLDSNKKLPLLPAPPEIDY